jgi:hypothetical protein
MHVRLHIETMLTQVYADNFFILNTVLLLFIVPGI